MAVQNQGDQAEAEKASKAEVSKKRTKLVRIGAVGFFIAGALALISSFLPWVTTTGIASTSGWNIAQILSRGGFWYSRLWTAHFWGFDGGIYFTGLCTFIVGLLLMILAVVLFVSGLRLIARIVASFTLLSTLFILLIVLFDWVTIALTGRDIAQIYATPAPGTGVGIILLLVAGVVGCVGAVLTLKPFNQAGLDRRNERREMKRVAQQEGADTG